MFWRNKKIERMADDAAIFLQVFAFRNLTSLAEMVRREFHSTPSDEGQYQAFIELVVFFLYLFDRKAFSSLGPQRRGVFMGALLTRFMTRVGPTLRPGSRATDLFSRLTGTFTARSEEYARYPLLGGLDGELANTSLWAASEHLMTTLCPDGPKAVFFGYTHLAASITGLFESTTYRSVK